MLVKVNSKVGKFNVEYKIYEKKTINNIALIWEWTKLNEYQASYRIKDKSRKKILVICKKK